MAYLDALARYSLYAPTLTREHLVKIAAISIQKYRSIKRTDRLNLADLTVLVGPNNEGKSNVLRALAVSMQLVRLYGLAGPGLGRRATRRSTPSRIYDWFADFPKDLQDRTPEGNSIIDLWFELTTEEQTRFRKEIGSRLNAALPIRLTVGQRYVEFAVRKQGRGGVALTEKSAQIAQFVGRSLRVEHVESVRTADRARRVIQDMVGIELSGLENDDAFSSALATLTDAVRPVADRLSADLASTLQAFLPDVKGVEIGLATDRIIAALSSQVQITVDDGVSTELQHKGDGVQSLAALALIRKAADVRRGAIVLAVEEPEAHLHPRAIHQLREVLNDIAVSQQVVLTTHSGVLVDRQTLSNNILVRSNHAAPASSIEEIRDALGVRVGDNLSQAELVLVVEGGCDSAALTALLSYYSPSLLSALSNGTLAIESLRSASNLTARLDGLRHILCRIHVLLDNDRAGQDAARKARDAGLLQTAEENFAIVPGLKESEFEDLLDPACYVNTVREALGVDLEVKEFKHNKAKWSDRAEQAFRSQGKNWSDQVKTTLKTLVAMRVAEVPESALHPSRSSSLVSLVSQLESRLTTP